MHSKGVNMISIKRILIIALLFSFVFSFSKVYAKGSMDDFLLVSAFGNKMFSRGIVFTTGTINEVQNPLHEIKIYSFSSENVSFLSVQNKKFNFKEVQMMRMDNSKNIFIVGIESDSEDILLKKIKPERDSFGDTEKETEWKINLTDIGVGAVTGLVVDRSGVSFLSVLGKEDGILYVLRIADPEDIISIALDSNSIKSLEFNNSEWVFPPKVVSAYSGGKVFIAGQKISKKTNKHRIAVLDFRSSDFYSAKDSLRWIDTEFVSMSVPASIAENGDIVAVGFGNNATLDLLKYSSDGEVYSLLLHDFEISIVNSIVCDSEENIYLSGKKLMGTTPSRFVLKIDKDFKIFGVDNTGPINSFELTGFSF